MYIYVLGVDDQWYLFQKYMVLLLIRAVAHGVIIVAQNGSAGATGRRIQDDGSGT